MAHRAKFWNKVRKWLTKKLSEEKPEVMSRNSIGVQVAKLLRERGSEVITMTTL